MTKNLYIDCEHHPNANIFEMMVAVIFSDFMEVLCNNKHMYHVNNDTYRTKQELLTMFQTLETSIEVITNRYNYDGCETLEKLSIRATATNIFKDFNKLFLMYCDIVEDIGVVIMNHSDKDLYYLKKYLKSGQSDFNFSYKFNIQKPYPDTELYSSTDMMRLINNTKYRPGK